jgi:hypothetical protein
LAAEIARYRPSTTGNERHEIWRISERFEGFAEADFGIAHKNGLPPTMTVDGRPILLINFGRGERI